jgi:hypothetical protein
MKHLNIKEELIFLTKTINKMNELTKREFIATELMKALVSKYTLNKPEDQITLAELSIQLADTLLDKLND